MTEKKKAGLPRRKRVADLEKRLKLAEAASGIGAFELDLASKHWAFNPQLATLFGLDPHQRTADLRGLAADCFRR